MTKKRLPLFAVHPLQRPTFFFLHHATAYRHNGALLGFTIMKGVLMDYRTLGTSNVKVTPVALGAWAIGGWLWGGTDDKAALAGIARAIDLGMTTIDTAAVYGFGHSEKIVGQAIKGRRDEVQILTKFGQRWDTDKGSHIFQSQDNEGRPITIHRHAPREGVFYECENSLKRMGIDCVDLYQHHWPDPDTPIAETMEACATLLKQGKIRAVGVSNYTPAMLDEAIKVVPLASVQPPYSMLRRDIEADLVPWCLKHKVGILAYSPLQNGILTGKVPLDRKFPPTDLRSRSKFYTPENRKRINDFLKQLEPIAAKHKATVGQVVINWTIQQPGITTALVGVRNPAQAEENAGAVAFTLTAAETREIDAKVEALKLE
jgi:aryl-alcohol dehydrogenase-like predicted oxidoreductase